MALRTGCALLLLAAAAAVGSASAGASVLLVDSRQNDYLHAAAREAAPSVSQAELQGIVAALTGLQPLAHVDSLAAQQIAGVVKASPLSSPQAHVSLTVSGLTPEELAALFSGRTQVAAALKDVEADAVTEVLAQLAEANPDVAFQLLEQVAAQQCGKQGGNSASCIEQLMPAVATVLGAEFNSETSSLVLPDGTQLDLQQHADKAFAMELAAAAVGVQELLKTRVNQDVLLMDLSMLALPHLASTYGQGSAEAVAAKSAVVSVLQWALQRLDQHFDGDVTVQASSVGSDSGVKSLDDALAWKSYRHARVLQTVIATDSTPSWLQGNETQLAQRFSAKAAGYGAFILLLYFLLLGIYCLCNMPFQRDTMLFGAKKND